MGRGAIVIGLAAVIIGEVIFGKIFKNFALRLLAVAFLKILATSVISTIKVLCPLARSSEAPTLVKIRSTMPIFAEDAGTKLPI